ncbi:MAG: M12 family metallo-peptidase [Chitinophagales bacterium]|nr:M12 family metallo-peptidase [Chitinophagales bacterium]MDW8419973.1 zinc-dependent metalloprotease family protein [Chitinophagales bacterium]
MRIVFVLGMLTLWFTASATPIKNSNAKNTSSPKTKWWRWQPEQEVVHTGARLIIPQQYRVAAINLQQLIKLLASAPLESNSGLTPTNLKLSFPMPDGTAQVFAVYESPIMEKGLAVKFPEIKTYAGYGISDPSATLRFDITPQGFHALILSAYGAYFIDPYCRGNTSSYIVYDKKHFVTDKKLVCHVQDSNEGANMTAESAPGTAPSSKHKILIGDCQKRTYRIAIAATGEYTAFHGGTVSQALAAQVTTMNRVNGIYEREAAVRMNIIANNNSIIYTNASTDPYTNGNPSAMIGENQTNLTNVIGSANYDIGHVFGTNAGGLAGLGVVCSNSNKARGVTCNSSPVGDPFDVDYVSHEIGHQFGANHTFNSTASSCSPNVSSSSAFEPGSGSTIMGYSGLCGSQNVQTNSDDYFHVKSLIDIRTFITTGSGNNCAVKSSLNNSAPTITNNGGSHTIPISTPFMLTATASDPDAANVLTYCWEQYDNQSSTQPPQPTNTGGPNFRSYPPDTSPTRYFPRLQSIVTNANPTWEVLPSVSRTMNFQISVRDNAPLGSCIDRSNITVTTTSGAGPFVVTYPSATGITWQAGTQQTITWDVANTNASPVNCSAVDIFLSLNGGYAYPIVLATNVPNNGSHTITVPNNPTTQARVMVKGRNNIFFDISNNNFTITAPQNDYTISTTSSTASVCVGGAVTYPIVIGKVGNYTSPVTLSVTGLPGAATASFSTNPVIPAGNTTLTVQTTSALNPGTYSFTVQAVSASGNKTLTLQLNAYILPGAPTLTSPSNAFNGFPTGGILTWSAAQGAASYIVQVATDSAFGNIIRTDTTASTSITCSPPLSPSTLYYWRVFALNACGTGSSSAVRSFITGGTICKTYTSTDVPKTISSSGTPTVTSTLTVPDNGIISDVDVSNLTGTHTYISDLRFELRSPANAISHLMRYVCTSQDNFNIKFDDEAANPYSAIPCPPTNGQYYRPFSPLSALDGGPSQGTWTLLVKDTFNTDGGSLNAWSIRVCFTVPCQLSASAQVTNASCSGTCDGALAVSVQSPHTPFTYLWSNGATAPSLTQVCAGAYTVTVTDASGCTASAQATVQNNNPLLQPTISISANANLICPGTQVTFTAAVSNAGNNPSYQWKKNGINVGTNSPVYTDNALSNQDSVWCVLTVSQPCVTSTVVTSNKVIMSVSASVTPAVQISAPSQQLCAGQSVTITASVLGGGNNPAYQWSVNGVNTGGNTPSLTLSNPSDGDSVRVFVISSENCASPSGVYSNTLVFTVNPLVQPTINIAAADDTICAGSNAVFTLSSTGGGSSPVYEWRVNGAIAATNTNVLSAALNDGDVVQCFMTSSLACVSAATVSSNSITIHVLPIVQPSVSITGSNQPVCSGQPITLQAAATGAGSSPQYQWFINGQSSGTSSPSITSAFQDGDTVVLQLTSNAQCAQPTVVTSAPYVAVVSPLVQPSVSISTFNTAVCEGDVVVFTANAQHPGAAPQYTWKINGTIAGTGDNIVVTNIQDGDVVVCEMTSSALCANPATVSSNPITMQVKPVPAAPAASSNSPVCDNEVLQFTASGVPNADYIWYGPGGYYATGQTPSIVNPSASFSGTYFVHCTLNGCSGPPAHVPVTIHVSPPKPYITLSGNTLTSSAAQGNQWWLNASPLSGATGQSFTASETGWYKVSVTSADGCVSFSDSLFVLITGLQHHTGGATPEVYPNPSPGLITIAPPRHIQYEYDVKIMAPDGRVVKETTTHIGVAVYDINEFPAGVYVVQVHAGGNTYSARIVKM